MHFPLLLLLPVASASHAARHVGNARRGGAWTLHAEHDAAPCALSRCSFADGDHALTNPLFTAFRQRVARWEDADAVQLDAVPRVTMRVSSTTIDHMDKLTVSYQVHGRPGTENDWIGADCMGNETSPSQDHDYIDWRWTDGKSVDSVPFGPLTNMRCVWQFRFFASLDSSTTYTKLAESDCARFQAGATQPQQVHLAMTQDPTQSRVS